MNDYNFEALRAGRAGAVMSPGLPDGGTMGSGGHNGEVPVLTRYFRVAYRWKWLILGSVVAALIVGLVATLLMTPLYTATSTIEISREANKVVQIEGVEPETNAVDQEFYQTQYGLLRSQSLAEAVVRDLKLTDNAAFFAMFDENVEEVVVEGDEQRLRSAGRDQRSLDAARILLENISINPVRLSRLAEVSFTSPDPVFSAQVVNSWTEHFIESNLQRRFEATSYARKFLEDRLQQLRQRLEESERQMVAFAANQGIVNLSTPVPGGEGATQERSILADDLTAMNEELARATSDRVRAESRLQQAGGGAVSESLQNPAIYNLRQKRAELAAQYSSLLTQFEPEYPSVKALASQLRELDASIAREESRVSQSFQSNYRDAMEREQAIAARVQGLKSGLMDERRRSIQYNIYQRDVDTNRELYNGLLQRYKEIGVAGGVGTNNIAIVDPARPPELPSAPNLLMNLLLSFIVGLLLGIALTFAAEQIDETIADPSAIVRALNLPLLGTIPVSKEASPLDALQDRKSPLVEAYLSVQTSLEFSTDHGVPKTLAVSSTRASEGKSTTAFAIATSLARAKRKVILIDGDMRSPSVHGLLNLRNDHGLSNYLTGHDDVRSLVHTVGQWGIDAMSAGPIPPNAGELLTGERLGLLLTQLTQHYDHVVIDSPPVLGLADAPLIASRVEGVIFAVESHGTRVGLIRVAIGRLADANARILGTVLTKFESKRAHLGYGYDYGYGYGSAEPAKA